MRSTSRATGLVYANPPFDDELGGGKREEFTFAEHSTKVLKIGGVLVLVLPLSAIESNWRFQEFLDGQYEEAGVFAWPEEYRHFREVVYIGRRRKEPIPLGSAGHLRSIGDRDGFLKLSTVGSVEHVWRLPGAKAPNTFEKTMFTEAEMIAEFANSPLNRRLAAPHEAPPSRPPLSLCAGHVSLRLASGQLNGVVYPKDEPPHVVRGTSRKQGYQSKMPESTFNEETRTTTTREVWSERIVLTIRTASVSGEILTFENGIDENPSNVKPTKKKDK